MVNSHAIIEAPVGALPFPESVPSVNMKAHTLSCVYKVINAKINIEMSNRKQICHCLCKLHDDRNDTKQGVCPVTTKKNCLKIFPTYAQELTSNGF